MQAVTGPNSPQGAPATTYTYDAYARVRTVTDPDSYTLTFDYDKLDRLTRTTFPDATFTETVYNRLDSEKYRNQNECCNEIHDRTGGDELRALCR